MSTGNIKLQLTSAMNASNLVTELQNVVNAINSVSSTEDKFGRFLDANGDGSGLKNIGGQDYSALPQPFSLKITPAAGQQIVIDRLIVFAMWTGAYREEYYGPTAALTNGIDIKKKIGGVTESIVDSVKIKYQAQYAAYCHDQSAKTNGSGNNGFSARWSFHRSKSIVLNGDDGDEFWVELQDNFSTIVDHYFWAEGDIQSL